jgi:hypothetical protein
MDAACAPERVGGLHLADERAEIGGDRGSARLSPPGCPRPGERKRAPVPANNRVGRDDMDGPSPIRPQHREQHPQEAIDRAQPGPPGCLALQDGQLMPEREDLRLELDARPKTGSEGGDQGDERCGHGGRERYQATTRICNDDKTFGVSDRDNSGLCGMLRPSSPKAGESRATAVLEHDPAPRQRSAKAVEGPAGPQCTATVTGTSTIMRRFPPVT